MGKTQICLQLCSTVQLPECLGGLNGKAIYLDTEGAFNPERMLQIVKSTQGNGVSTLKMMYESKSINAR